MMHDRFGRTIRYLRLSLTSRCSMRCVYCRPAVLPNEGPDSNLNVSEIETMVRHLVTHHGIRKVRLTGGEPTTRPDLLAIIQRLARIDGLNELAMTTNGLTLVRQAAALVDAGLQRVNVSLDSLQPDRFRRITGIDSLTRVLEGIEAAAAAGLTPVKLNAVVVRDENADELPDLVHFAAARGLEIRFIELMPMGPLASSWTDRFVPESHMRQTLEPTISHWRALLPGSDSARRYRAELTGGGQVTIGFITAMSCHFCDHCDRIRIAANGDFFPCLMDRPMGNLLPTIRPRFDAERFDASLLCWLDAKAPKHPAQGPAAMIQIGG